MITSRQVIKILKDELKKDLDDSARDALRRVKDKIEFLEEIEYLEMYKQPNTESTSEARKKAEAIFK
jgi:hypothetical protein